MKRFLASVGNAELLQKVDGKLELFATAHTLTDSAISITSTMDDIRAGQGAQLYGRFNHDTGMTVTLTETMFDLNYIAAQVGADIAAGGTALKTISSADHAGEMTLTPNALTLPAGVDVKNVGNACGMDTLMVWIKPLGSCSGNAMEVKAYEVIKVEGEANTYAPAKGVFAAFEGDFCVSYFAESPDARTATIKANFNPKELVLILTAQLFAGDASHPESGKPIGSITVKVPRFQLDGSFDLSMAMSSAATISLNGTALVSEGGTCEGDGVYAEIVEVVNGRGDAEIAALAFEGGELEVVAGEATELPDVYAIYANGDTEKMDIADITYEATKGTVADGKITTDEDSVVTATLTGTTINTTLTVTVGE